MPQRLHIAGGMVLLLAALAATVPGSAPAKARCGGKAATVVGTSGDDRIRVPRSGKQVIAGLGGNDVIFAFNGKDRICGNSGNDRILTGQGADKAFGGPGDDVIVNSRGADKANGEGGSDTITGGLSSDNISGGPGDDLISSGGKQDRVHGNGGNDHLIGGEGADDMFGDDGNDLIQGGSGAENAHGGPGDDRVQGDLLDDFLFGEGGADVIVGGQGIDLMRAGPGNDWLRGGQNQDEYFGEAGADTASFVTALPNEDQPGVTVNLTMGRATGDGGRDDLSGIEHVLGSTFTDIITGNGADNEINAGPGNDTVDGGAGSSDTTDGGPGDDTCTNGETEIRCDPESDPPPSAGSVWMNAEGPDPGMLILGRTTGSPGGAADDLSVSASATAYLIDSPNAGSFAAYGSPGDVCATTATGASCPKPAAPLAYIIFFGAEGDDKLRVAGANYPPQITADLEGGDGGDAITGSPGDDVIISGETGLDVLRGANGSDALISEGTGRDTLQGEGGDDQLVSDDPCQGHRYSGGAGFDIAGFGRYDLAISGNGRVRAKMGGTATDPGRANCSPTTIANDLEILEGSAGDDTLLGSNRKDFLILGREGDDVIRGGGNNDLLLGNGGADSLFGDGGFDSLDAKDGERDKVINCGPGGGEAKTDGKDPRAVRCRR